MDEATLERRLHLNITQIVGLWLDMRMFINRQDIAFGSAQNWKYGFCWLWMPWDMQMRKWFFRIIALIIYVALSIVDCDPLS